MKSALILSLMVLVSCTGGDTPRPTATPTGAPSIEVDTIGAHAEQFEKELPERSAGSQQEFAAATYITAHLQQAGYVVEFDSVPVANTVRSTNVVALPPSTEDPEYLVAVAYDEGSDPETIGAFLELARALRVVEPHHAVEFAALGAENAEEAGGALGSRRMAQLLGERDLDPAVIQLIGTTQETWAVDGFIEDELCESTYGPTDDRAASGCVLTGAALDIDTFAESGFDRSLIAGPAADVATFLLGYLSR